MSQDTSLAGRYARALQILLAKQAVQANQPAVPMLERACEELEGVAKLVAPGSRIGNFLVDPQISPDHRRAALKQGLTGRTMPAVQVFADLLLRKRRINLAGSIAHEFRAIVERAKGLERATVVSAAPLTADEVARLQRELETATGKKIVLEKQVDPALLGGAYVRIGDRVVDRSVKTLLEAIANQLLETSV